MTVPPAVPSHLQNSVPWSRVVDGEAGGVVDGDDVGELDGGAGVDLLEELGGREEEAGLDGFGGGGAGAEVAMDGHVKTPYFDEGMGSK